VSSGYSEQSILWPLNDRKAMFMDMT
jgi:hypothetical protein